MSIPIYTQRNFETLVNAARDGNLAAFQVRDRETNEMVTLVVAINRPYNKETKEHDFELVPLAVMIDGDPYTRYDANIEHLLDTKGD